jgi:hypothetical protein
MYRTESLIGSRENPLSSPYGNMDYSSVFPISMRVS